MANGKCPMCNGNVRVSSTTKVGSMVYCDSCDAELEIVSLKPLELDWPLYDYGDEFDDEKSRDYSYEDSEGYEYDEHDN